MEFVPSRLRHGELIAGAGGVLTLVFMFALPWYGLNTPLGWTAATLGVPTSYTGWDSLSHSRYLVLITALVALALVFFQAARRSPAIPVSLSVIVTVLGTLTAIVLFYRVLLSIPGPGGLHRRVGAYLGLVSGLTVVWGGYRSLRQEGIAPADAPGEIEVVSLKRATPV